MCEKPELNRKRKSTVKERWNRSVKVRNEIDFEKFSLKKSVFLNKTILCLLKNDSTSFYSWIVILIKEHFFQV